MVKRETHTGRPRARTPSGRPRPTRPSAAGRKSSGTDDAARSAQQELLQGVQQVLLAGMGAISRAQQEGPAAFTDAVSEGLRMLNTSRTAAQRMVRDAFGGAQATLHTRVGDVREQAQETWDNLEALFQSRVQRAMHQVGMPTAEEIRALTRRVAELNENVKRLEARAGTRRGVGPKRRSAPPGARRGSTRRTAATE